MTDTQYGPLHRMLLFAFGAASTTADGIKSFVDSMVEKGEIAKPEADGLIKDLQERAERVRTETTSMVDRNVTRHLSKAGLATREDMEQLQQRIQELEEKLAEQKPAE